MSTSATVKCRKVLFGLFTHGLVALAAIVAAYFFLFYGYHYLFAPSVPASARCSPGAMSYLAASGNGERIRMVESHCAPGWSDIGLYLEDAKGKVSPPFLVLSGKRPVLRAGWSSPGNVSVDMTANDVRIEYALDRFEGLKMDYSLHEIPAPRR